MLKGIGFLIMIIFSILCLPTDAVEKAEEISCIGWNGPGPDEECIKWSNGVQCMRHSGFICGTWSNGVSCTRWSGTDDWDSCAAWSNGFECQKWADNSCAVWNNGDRCLRWGGIGANDDCSKWSSGANCLKWAGNRCARWSKIPPGPLEQIELEHMPGAGAGT